MGKGKNGGQSLARKLKRGNMDEFGNILKRPFNNSKRGKNSFQIQRETFYKGMKDYISHLKQLEDAEDNTEEDKEFPNGL
jgi:hypothetical protein